MDPAMSRRGLSQEAVSAMMQCGCQGTPVRRVRQVNQSGVEGAAPYPLHPDGFACRASRTGRTAPLKETKMTSHLPNHTLKQHLPLILAVPLLASAALADDLVLSSGGKTGYVIVLPKDAIPSETRAANELASFLQQIGGAAFPVQDDGTPLSEKAILLGNNAHLAGLGVKPDWGKLGKEGFLLRTAGPHLVLAGGRPRGTMYGVYAFLEDKLGCRWYTSKISKIPHRDEITVDELNETQVPALEYREPFNTDGFDADWASRNRCNSNAAALTEEHGGKITTIPFVHSFYQLIPPATHFADHPDWFSEIDGKRTADGAQLCLTNPEVTALMIEKVKETIKAHPEAVIVSVSQNDWRGNCQCAKCKAIDDAEGSPAGSLVTFVNAVAAEVGKEYPDLAIDTLAYQYTRKPPKTVRPLPNVIIRLCSIECDFGQPLATGERNKSFADDIRGWHELCDRLYIWDYITSFSHYMVPFPNLHTLGPNVRFFAENGVKGIFEEGNYGPGGCGECNELRNYLLAKLLWNPNVDENAVRQDFLAGVYGPAAQPLEEYLRSLQRAVEKQNVAVPCWFTPDAPIFTDDLIANSEALFDKAEAAVGGDQELLLRVRQARMPIDYVVLNRNAGKSQGTWKLTDTRFEPTVPDPVAASNRRFFETAKAVGLNNLHEGGQSHNPVHVEEFHNRVGVALGGVDVDWIKGERFAAALAPELGCRVVAVREAASKTDRAIFSTSSAQAAGAPAYQEVFFPNLGVDTPFAPDAGEYATDLPNGLNVRRNVTVLPAGFQLVSKVRNGGQDQPVQASGRLLLTLSGAIRATGAFGERAVPALEPGAAANVVLTPAEVANQPVTFASAEGASVTIAVQGPLAGLSAGRGPDGLFGVAVAFEVPTLKAGESTQWTSSLTFSEQTAGAKADTPGALECQAAMLPCYREGELSGKRFEPTAADGRASYIIGSTNEWALQWSYPAAQFQPGRKYDVLAAVRILAADVTVTGVGLTCGVYSVPNAAYKTGSDLKDDACKPGQWQWLKVGTVTPEGGDYVWFAPAKNPTVKEIQLDRILMVPATEGG
ncbi:MAG: hypothetical protein COY42_16000 [Armatimonadetes bacterium CG_4_10_14_0_8_um_filter_66_14]|nr:MAG: hypothetical protein COZ57_27995 [Armatimonadetes bacterium CG_4_8_14_3_um_filter_66_20]PIZ43342.1 MAG: hypothetical protein COY42_16000 [Armatimonadetes bacterium CG_4_10_14_0_8_um_filter_66_14]